MKAKLMLYFIKVQDGEMEIYGNIEIYTFRQCFMG